MVVGWLGVARTEGGDPRDKKQFRVAHTPLEGDRCRIQFRLFGTRSILGLPVAVVVRSRDDGKDEQGGCQESEQNAPRWLALRQEEEQASIIPNAKSKHAGTQDKAAVEDCEVVARHEAQVEPVVEDLTKVSRPVTGAC